MKTQDKIGFVLCGGGARAAYQVGALKGIFAIAKELNLPKPYDVLTGISAGAINASYLACNSQDPYKAMESLEELWAGLHTDNIFRSDRLSLYKIGFRLFVELSLGRFIKKKQSKSLLDTNPLYTLLKTHISSDKIQKNIEENNLTGVAIRALNYSTGFAETFFHAHSSIKPWTRLGRKGIASQINAEHVAASAAIPIIFPPVKIGPHYYGDGNLRNHTPISPAIKLGAQKLFLIGVKKPLEELKPTNTFPSLARMTGMALNAILLDSLDHDFERLNRINKTLSHLKQKNHPSLKPIDCFMIRPSENLSEIAANHMKYMPKSLQHLIRGLGTKREASDLISYLLFEPQFIKKLIKLGYEDTMNQKDAIAKFYTH